MMYRHVLKGGGTGGGALGAAAGHETLWRACMNQVQQWARLRARTTCPLRRGAWYRVVQLTDAEAILDVNGRPLSVPRAFLQVLPIRPRSEEHTSELQSQSNLVCRLLLEKKKSSCTNAINP